MFKINKDILFLFNSLIIEYDIKQANISLCQEFNLLSSSLIEIIKNKNKAERVVAIGKLMRKDKEFAKNLENKFNDVIHEFMEINNLNFEKDVVSIKRDAVFVANKNIKYNQIGNHIFFDAKNIYHAYLYIKPYEFYFKKDGNIDVKGIPDNMLELHKNGILSLLNIVVETIENSNFDQYEINKLFKDIITIYKNKKFDKEYVDIYREFNSISGFKLKSEDIVFNDINSQTELNNIDITYNYINIILPLFKTLCV
jgi:predicted house-cleaning noncanonical NTP pyrophosphatase (MazG superfamily)